ncbi:hypothetical protein, partial [Microcoleus sp. herbarium5]|uniref:hypothetical protein n=1 Tax=Microcoleus sp. herbarium5 TaxID=3055434 RepID=UPI002FD035A8
FGQSVALYHGGSWGMRSSYCTSARHPSSVGMGNLGRSNCPSSEFEYFVCFGYCVYGTVSVIVKETTKYMPAKYLHTPSSNGCTGFPRSRPQFAEA